MNRDKAIEAARRTLREAPWRRGSRLMAQEIVDAIAHHLVGVPVGYVVVEGPLEGGMFSTSEAARAWAERKCPGGQVFALVPVEEP